MSRGRGSAVAVAILVAAAMVVVLHFEVAETTSYTVGDAGGWTYNVATWPKGKRFKAGDTLVFNYSSAMHNVVGVDKAGYQGCTTTGGGGGGGGGKVYQTGKDQIKLGKGTSYFICSIPGHCQSGMKIAVTAV